VPSGSIFTNDDVFTVTGAVGSTAGSDYAVLQFFVLPPTASENGGDILANGTFLIANDNDSTFQLFNGQMALLATVAGLTSTVSSIVRTCLTTQVFYVAKTPLNGHISRVDGNGAVTASWVLPGTSLTCLGASNDETIIYVGGNGGSVNSAIKQFNPATSLFGADLAPGLANYTTVDLLVMGDGSVVVIYTYTNSTQPTIIKRYNAAGTTLNTYTIGIPTGDRTEVSLFHALDDPTSFWTRVHDMVADATCTFYNIKASDGTILTTVTQATYEDGALEIAVPTATPSARFGLSGSCPSFILREAITSVATVDVLKITVPSGSPQAFSFTTTKLTPATFTLHDGEIQSYDDLTPDSGYGVTETPVAGWVTTYEVSNGDPHDAITLGAGDAVIVTVTNTHVQPPPVSICPPARSLAQVDMGCIMPLGDF
jgi:hypothetical protein